MIDIAESIIQPVIGLEIHVQLSTNSKLFCGCSISFGEKPNSQVCPTCLGLPGALPVLNHRALQLAIRSGIALNCRIQTATKWDRKNYFYPDLPKGYQISQFDRPICYDGYVDLVDKQGQSVGKKIRIDRAHLEEDAGKSTHDESGNQTDSKIDLNRAGTPLLEIVTHPDLSSAAEARNFLNELKLILTYADVSDCDMQKGNLRVDANINLHIGSEPVVETPIVEIKNLNSFRAVERAILFEIDRQKLTYRETGIAKDKGTKQTRGWDDDRQCTVLQREKEDSADYRYFPDPDLVTIHTSASQITAQKKELGESPAEIRCRLASLELSIYEIDVLVRQGRGVIEFFDQANESVGAAKLVSNWIQQEVLRYLNENQISIRELPMSLASFCSLLNDVENSKLDQNRAKDIFKHMLETGTDFQASKAELGIFEVDRSQLSQLCQQVIQQHPQAIADLKAGNMKAIGALIGAGKKINPNINPGEFRSQLLEIIGH